MRATVVVFVAVAVAAMASAAVVQERVKRGARGPVRLRIQESRIARLANQVADLEDLADERLGSSSHDALVGMQSRLDQEFGSRCPANEFSCSGLSRGCVSNLQVCDGTADCDNGHDEAASTCTLLAAAGETFKGGRVWDDCSNRKPYEIEVVFTDSARKEWFGSRAKVDATVILRSKGRGFVSVASLPSSGTYSYATRSLWLDPPEDDRLGLELIFDTGNSDSVDAYIVRESTGKRCAQFVLFRQ